MAERDEKRGRWGRWVGTLQAGRAVLETFGEIGGYLARHSLEELGGPPEQMVDDLRDETGEMLGAFPDIAAVYEDVERFDDKLVEGLDNGRDDDALSHYLDWLRHLVDAVIGRAVEVAFGTDEPALTPERVEELLERVDSLLRIVLERWVIPALLDAGPSRSERDE